MRSDDCSRFGAFRGLADLQLDAAAHAAVGARGLDLARGRYGIRWRLDADGSGGTDAEALPAGGADAFGQRFVARGGNTSRPARSQHVDGADELVTGLAGVDAAGAQDARIHGEIEHRVGFVGWLARPGVPSRFGNAVQTGGFRQQAVIIL